MNRPSRKTLGLILPATLLLGCLFLSGCAAALIAGGVAGGYMVAQHVEVKPKK